MLPKRVRCKSCVDSDMRKLYERQEAAVREQIAENNRRVAREEAFLSAMTVMDEEREGWVRE